MNDVARCIFFRRSSGWC